MIRNFTQNAKPSFTFQEGLGMRLRRFNNWLAGSVWFLDPSIKPTGKEGSGQMIYTSEAILFSVNN